MNTVKTWAEWKTALTTRQIEAYEERECPTDKDRVSTSELFRAILEDEGIIGYDYWIKSAIAIIYGVALDEAERKNRP